MEMSGVFQLSSCSAAGPPVQLQRAPVSAFCLQRCDRAPPPRHGQAQPRGGKHMAFQPHLWHFWTEWIGRKRQDWTPGQL